MCGGLFSFRHDACLMAELEAAAPPPWEARVQEFRAGAVGVSGVLVLQPADDSDTWTEDEARFWPLTVAVLDECRLSVSPGLHELLAGADGSDDERLCSPLAGGGRWSVLDGPEPLVKLSVRGCPPLRLDFDLVFPAVEIADLLHLAATNLAIGLMSKTRALSLPADGTVASTLAQAILVPTLPSPELGALVRRRGWPSDGVPGGDR